MNARAAWNRKDLLLRVLRKMKAVHGDVYGFHPDGYLLPTEYTKFIDAFTHLRPVSGTGAFLPRRVTTYTHIFHEDPGHAFGRARAPSKVARGPKLLGFV